MGLGFGGEGFVTVMTRALALAGIAGAIGLGQSLVADDPIYLERRTAEPTSEDAKQTQRPDAPTTEERRRAPSERRESGSATDEQRAAPEPDRSPPTGGEIPGGIGLEQAHELWNQGVPFIDGRVEDEYVAGHVPGAFHMTPAELSRLSQDAMDALAFLDPGMPVVIYCYGGACEASEDLAILLENSHGFADVRILVDSFEAWEEAGYPVEEGEGAMP